MSLYFLRDVMNYLLLIIFISLKIIFKEDTKCFCSITVFQFFVVPTIYIIGVDSNIYFNIYYCKNIILM